ncbi:hypothetical protein [Polycladidibacter hongkongensis]|uniref:hypothetical protein n=1 Tax=Polycladidibacter hongkongensis TaxID=1647556 RepID=UPI00082B49CC|nr:hypothetical protein [Pseudovibrio hongkongensis]
MSARTSLKQISLLLIATCVFSTLASAQADKLEQRAGEQEAATGYSLLSTSDGVVRMDNATGAVSLCRQQGEDLICRPSLDAMQTLQQELDGLIQQNRNLRLEVNGLRTLLNEAGIAAGENLPPPPKSKQGKAETGSWYSADDEKRLDQALEFTQKAMRSFAQSIKELEREFADEKPSPDTPENRRPQTQ